MALVSELELTRYQLRLTFQQFWSVRKINQSRSGVVDSLRLGMEWDAVGSESLLSGHRLRRVFLGCVL
jgi:hypothetical protein